MLSLTLFLLLTPGGRPISTCPTMWELCRYPAPTHSLGEEEGMEMLLIQLSFFFHFILHIYEKKNMKGNKRRAKTRMEDRATDIDIGNKYKENMQLFFPLIYF